MATLSAGQQVTRSLVSPEAAAAALSVDADAAGAASAAVGSGDIIFIAAATAAAFPSTPSPPSPPRSPALEGVLDLDLALSCSDEFLGSGGMGTGSSIRSRGVEAAEEPGLLTPMPPAERKANEPKGLAFLLRPPPLVVMAASAASASSLLICDSISPATSAPAALPKGPGEGPWRPESLPPPSPLPLPSCLFLSRCLYIGRA